MRSAHFLVLALSLLASVPSATLAANDSGVEATLAATDIGAKALQQEGPGRGDDLARIKSWRTFLTTAERAFFAGRMNTAAVQSKVEEADTRIEELENAAKPDAGGRSDITGDVAFLERSLRAFTAAGMSTTEVQKWLTEARDKD